MTDTNRRRQPDHTEEARKSRPSSGRRPGTKKASGSGSPSHSPRHRGKRKSRRKGVDNYIHYIITGVIILIVVIALIRLIIWNIGRDSGYDPDADTSEFDTEALDYIQPLDPELLAGHEEDGVTTIVCLGNAPFSDETGKKGLAGLIAESCDATVYNCAFPDSCISMSTTEYSDSYPQDAFSLYLATASLCGGDFTLMDHAVSLLEKEQETAEAALKTLKDINFSQVDMIVMMYDLSDYMALRPVMDENNDINLLTWDGALNASIQLIQQTYPFIRIVVLSPSYGRFEDESGNMVDADTADYGNGALPDYVLHEIDVAMANGVSILDNYYGTINVDNYEDFLTDGYHLTQAGRERVAARFAREIFRIGTD